MSVDIKFNLKEEDINAVVAALRNVTGKSEEQVFKKAVNDTAKFARRELSSKAQKVYATSGIYARSVIKKATVGNLGAEIDFGNQQRVPSILKFRASPKATPTRFLKSGIKRRRIGGTYRMLGRQKKYTVKSSQWRAGGMTTYKSAFIATMGSGRTGMFVRSGQKTATGKEKLRQILGSTDRAMVRNEKVYPEIEPKIGEKLREQVQVALVKALGGK
jgi:hypothetical protein